MNPSFSLLCVLRASLVKHPLPSPTIHAFSLCPLCLCGKKTCGEQGPHTSFPSHIRFKNSASISRTFQCSSPVRRFSSVLSPFT